FVPQAMGTFAVGLVSHEIVKLLNDSFALLDDWRNRTQKSDRINEIIESIHRKPHLLRYLTPETKCRFLFDLTTTQKSWKDYPNADRNIDWNHKREEAAVTLNEMGISSLRDWRETLEHLCAITQDGRRVPYVTPGADPE